MGKKLIIDLFKFSAPNSLVKAHIYEAFGFTLVN